MVLVSFQKDLWLQAFSLCQRFCFPCCPSVLFFPFLSSLKTNALWNDLCRVVCRLVFWKWMWCLDRTSVFGLWRFIRTGRRRVERGAVPSAHHAHGLRHHDERQSQEVHGLPADAGLRPDHSHGRVAAVPPRRRLLPNGQHTNIRRTHPHTFPSMCIWFILEWLTLGGI